MNASNLNLPDAPISPPPAMSHSLEDYLETIYLLVQEQGFARVRDVARAREVKAASVSIALRRLAEMNLVKYERREYLTLTPEGEQAGRRVYARHQLLADFFRRVLQMDEKASLDQACAMEHSLTDEAMDRLASFIESLSTDPKGVLALLERFKDKASDPVPLVSLDHLTAGQSASIKHIEAKGPLRQRLLDMGILPDAAITLERVGLGGDPVWIRCQGAQLALRRNEAKSILVRRG